MFKRNEIEKLNLSEIADQLIKFLQSDKMTKKKLALIVNDAEDSYSYGEIGDRYLEYIPFAGFIFEYVGAKNRKEKATKRFGKTILLEGNDTIAKKALTLLERKGDYDSI